MAVGIERRQFISTLGGASVAWPFRAYAQQSNQMRRVGVLPVGYLQNDSEGQARVTAFLETLQKLGWSEGRNIAVEIRWSRNEIDQVRSEATELGCILINGRQII
jgi:hypothetical protein